MKTFKITLFVEVDPNQVSDVLEEFGQLTNSEYKTYIEQELGWASSSFEKFKIEKAEETEKHEM